MIPHVAKFPRRLWAMFSEHKMQSHFLRIKSTLKCLRCRITDVHTGNERRHIPKPSQYFDKIPYDDSNSPWDFMPKCGQMKQDPCWFPLNSTYSTYLIWHEVKCLSLSPTNAQGWGMCSFAAQPPPWAILGFCALLSSVHSIFIWFGNMWRK